MKNLSVAAFKLFLERGGRTQGTSLFYQLPFSKGAEVYTRMAGGAQHRGHYHRSYSLAVARPKRALSHPQDGPGLGGWFAHAGFSKA